jgi:hypothetical protein
MADDRPQESLQAGSQADSEAGSGEKPGAQPEDAALSPDSSRARRAPPTIDLDASEVSSETRNAGGDAAPESAPQEPEPGETLAAEALAAEPLAARSPPTASPISAPISPWVIAPVSGAVAAALVIGVGWMLGWPAVQVPAPAAPQVSAAAVDGLAARIAGLESKISKPVAPATDPAAIARIAALEKSQASLRDDIAALRAQSQKLAGDIGSAKSAPGDATAAAVDLSGINARLDQIESAARAQAPPETAKPADDALLRRVVVASLLELSVRQGEPFVATLNAAKALAPDAAALKPLESFAASGVPTAAVLSRELLLLVPKLSPPLLVNDKDNAAADQGLVDRLKAGAAKLIRIERTDAVGNDRGAIVARVTAAALRNDSSEARRELKMLPAADRAAAQSWIDKADARDAALAVSQQFATDAMAALAKPSQ